MNNENNGWSDIFYSFIGMFLISGTIGFILSIFAEFLGILFLVIIPLIYLIYLIYDTFGTKEKRKRQKELSNKNKEIMHKKFYNDDGTKKSKQQLKKEKVQEELKRINNLGIYPTKVISKDFVDAIVYIDDKNEKILFKTLYDEYIVNYNDIVDFELLMDDTVQIKYGVSTSITGTFKNKKVISSISVKIYLDNINTPIIQIKSLSGGSYHNFNSMEVYEARTFADELIGVLTYIKNKENK